jgi:hypothetical protein
LDTALADDVIRTVQSPSQTVASHRWTLLELLITYDGEGNVYEIDFPATTGPWPPP